MQENENKNPPHVNQIKGIITCNKLKKLVRQETGNTVVIEIDTGLLFPHSPESIS